MTKAAIVLFRAKFGLSSGAQNQAFIAQINQGAPTKELDKELVARFTKVCSAVTEGRTPLGAGAVQQFVGSRMTQIAIGEATKDSLDVVQDIVNFTYEFVHEDFDIMPDNMKVHFNPVEHRAVLISELARLLCGPTMKDKILAAEPTLKALVKDFSQKRESRGAGADLFKEELNKLATGMDRAIIEADPKATPGDAAKAGEVEAEPEPGTMGMTGEADIMLREAGTDLAKDADAKALGLNEQKVRPKLGFQWMRDDDKAKVATKRRADMIADSEKNAEFKTEEKRLKAKGVPVEEKNDGLRALDAKKKARKDEKEQEKTARVEAVNHLCWVGKDHVARLAAHNHAMHLLAAENHLDARGGDSPPFQLGRYGGVVASRDIPADEEIMIIYPGQLCQQTTAEKCFIFKDVENGIDGVQTYYIPYKHALSQKGLLVWGVAPTRDKDEAHFEIRMAQVCVGIQVIGDLQPQAAEPKSMADLMQGTPQEQIYPRTGTKVRIPYLFKLPGKTIPKETELKRLMHPTLDHTA